MQKQANSIAPQAAFDAAYAALNDAQRTAVDTIEGPVMVIAGPGTGKTTMLTLRIANILLRTDVPPSGILALTYTDAGVKAMREKLIGLIGARAHEVHIYTFHGFASSVISTYPEHFTQVSECRQMTDIEQESLVRQILEDKAYRNLRPLGRPDTYISPILSAIDASKRDALSPERVKAYAQEQKEAIANDESSISTRGATKGQLKAEAKKRIEKCERTILFADVYDAYEAKKRSLKLLDFSDLIVELLHALQNDELLLRLLQEQYLYIHIDEHQDTNDAQNAIIEAVATFFETPNLFIVGDEKQAIYRFQGASVENFLHLKKRWSQMKVVALETNYRSHQHILDAGFSLIEHNYAEGENEDLRIQLKAGGKAAPKPIDIIKAKDESASDAYLTAFLKKIIKEEPEASVALITRRNRELEKLLRLCEAEGISVASQRSVDIFSHPIGLVFFDLLEYLADPSRTDMLARTMVAGLWSLSLKDAAIHIRTLRSNEFEAEATFPALAQIRRSLLLDDPLRFLIEAASLSMLQEKIIQDATSSAVWRGIITLAESLVRDLGVESPLVLIEHLLAYRLSAQTKTVKVSVGTPDLPIRAMTAHGSKGLEFDYVCIPYATESAWVGRPRGDSFVLPEKGNTGEIKDLRRLFYVALTRARKHAVILTHEEESDGTVQLPVRFIEELDPASVGYTSVDRTEASLEHKAQIVLKQDTRAQAITDLAKTTLLTTGLSVTALNHFLEDPHKYLLESVLKLPQAPSASSEKGSAMHYAIDRVWKLAQKNEATIAEELQRAAQAYLSTSLLPKSEKERLLDELAEAAPHVARALLEHFSTQAKIETEHWVESAFVGAYKDEQIAIRLHGKLDAIITDENGTAVFDYKTRKSMSVAAIKGQTKSSTGNYFRQLVFYTKLMHDAHKDIQNVSASLVFVSPGKNGDCPIITLPVSDSDRENLCEEIQQLISYVWSGQLGNDCA